MSDPKPGAAADGTWQDKVLSATTSDHVQLSDSLLETDLQTYALPEDRKIGVWGAVFFIFNKVIGTGSEGGSPIAEWQHG